MPISGRYDFKGIQKAARVAIDALLAGTSWGIWLLKSPFKIVIAPIEDFIVNWLANRGLIILNIGAIMINGEIDQHRLDLALDEGIRKVKAGRDKLTPAQGAKIDQDVVDAFDADADLGAADRVSNVSGSSVRSGSDPTV